MARSQLLAVQRFSVFDDLPAKACSYRNTRICRKVRHPARLNGMKDITASSAVILARGLGTRMRKNASEDVALDSDQARAADLGMKGMIPIGRPFLDYVLSSLADAGLTRVWLVIGPEHDAVITHYTVESPPTRLSIEFAIQEKPLGTADAVLSAHEFAQDEPFVVLNSDNYYPAKALSLLRNAKAPAIVGFARSVLLGEGDVPQEKVQRFGALTIDRDGYLVRIVKRPGDPLPENDDEIYASMNCWLFDERIFEACRRVSMSPRNELELPRAVQLAIDEMGMRFKVIPVALPVLDLSTREDIYRVQQRLQSVNVRF
jgi:dTDP-glucose pyrophosphorylase